MKRLVPWLLLAARAFAEEPADMVDPRIGTATPRYDFFAAAAVPFGMVALSPDTKHGELWNAGYRYGDTHIYSFSHLHNIQLAGVPVMPDVDAPRGHLGLEATKAAFRHDEEQMAPGWHRLRLPERDIGVELTATCRAGLHRYDFPAGHAGILNFDLTAQLGPCPMEDAFARRISEREIEGWSRMAPTHRRKKTCTVYFVARFEEPFDRFGGWRPEGGGKILCEPVDGCIAGPGTGFFVQYAAHPDGRRAVLMKVGLSFVSCEQARRNLEAELPGWDAKDVRTAARRAWNDYLDRIAVEGGPREQRVKHYTDLFHTAVGKRVFSDVDGRYPDYSGCPPLLANTNPPPATCAPVIRQVPLDDAGRPRFRMLDMDCLWGGQWNLNLLWCLAYPEVGNEVAQTFLQYYRHDGTLPRGPWGGSDVYVMVGDPTTPLLAALVSHGRATFSVAEAFAASRRNAFPGGVRDRSGYEAVARPTGGGMPDYCAKGYVPVEVRERTTGWHSGGTALTLEYAYQDWCLAELARRAGQEDDEKLFRQRARNYRNVFDAETGWMRPRRADGSWHSPFAPTGTRQLAETGFVEGNAAVYTFYVPHDLPGLIELLGGPERFTERLDASFRRASAARFAMPHGQHSEGWVEYGNEPAGAMAHLFAHAGRPRLTQQWVREVRLTTFGGTTPDSGYSGDEDQGMLSALSVLMGIGLFDVQGGVGGAPDWELTPPLFDRVRIDAGGDRPFEIVVRNQAPSHPYIERLSWRGGALPSPVLTAEEVRNGGVLTIQAVP